MFCQKCGTQNPDDSKFCYHCGTPLSVAAPRTVPGGEAPQPVAPQPAPGGNTPSPAAPQPAQGNRWQPAAPQPAQGNRWQPAAPQPAQGNQWQPAAPQPAQGNQWQAAAPRPMQPENPVRTLLRTIGTGPLFLTGAISYTLALVFQFVQSFMPTAGLAGILYTVVNFLPREAVGDAEEIADAIRSWQTGSTISTLFSTLGLMLPSILILVSIWLIFAAVRDTTGKAIGTAGFTIIKVLAIIGIVGQVVAAFVVEFVIGALTVYVSQNSYDGSETPVFIIIMLVVALGFTLAILYNVKLVSSLGTMSKTAYTLVPSGKVSVYVAVICFISALFTLGSILFSLSIFGILNVLCKIVASVTFGILLLSYRSQMKALGG